MVEREHFIELARREEVAAVIRRQELFDEHVVTVAERAVHEEQDALVLRDGAWTVDRHEVTVLPAPQPEGRLRSRRQLGRETVVEAGDRFDDLVGLEELEMKLGN